MPECSGSTRPDLRPHGRPRRRKSGIEPHFGTMTWPPPSGYRAFLAVHNALVCRRRIHDLDRKFVIVDDEEIVELNADLVHIPEGVSRDAGHHLSANHLVGFAEAGHEAVCCFDVTRPDAD